MLKAWFKVLGIHHEVLGWGLAGVCTGKEAIVMKDSEGGGKGGRGAEVET